MSNCSLYVKNLAFSFFKKKKLVCSLDVYLTWTFRKYHTYSSLLDRSLGLETQLISPEECAVVCPFLRTDDVLGGLYDATDVSAGDPSDICRALAVGAQQQGGTDHITYICTYISSDLANCDNVYFRG